MQNNKYSGALFTKFLIPGIIRELGNLPDDWLISIIERLKILVNKGLTNITRRIFKFLLLFYGHTIRQNTDIRSKMNTDIISLSLLHS